MWGPSIDHVIYVQYKAFLCPRRITSPPVFWTDCIYPLSIEIEFLASSHSIWAHTPWSPWESCLYHVLHWYERRRRICWIQVVLLLVERRRSTTLTSTRVPWIHRLGLTYRVRGRRTKWNEMQIVTRHWPWLQPYGPHCGICRSGAVGGKTPAARTSPG